MNKQKKTLKCAVVGLGHIGRRHVAMIEAHPDLILQAVCDQDKSRHRVEKCPNYSSFDQMLSQTPGLDLIAIAVPNHLHIPFSVQAISAGANVLCEKPLGISTDRVKEMMLFASNKQKHIFCVLQNRYSPTIQWLVQILKEKRLGKIFTVQMNCFWNRDDRYYYVENSEGLKESHPWHGKLKEDGGPLYTQFSHFIDIAIALFGRLKIEHARFENFNHKQSTEFEDTGYVHFKAGENISGILNYTTSVWGANQESSINIIGENGTVKVGGQYMNRLEYCHVKGYTAPKIEDSGKVNEYGGYTGSANNHYLVYKNVADVLLKGAEPDYSTEDALLGVEAIESIYGYRKL